MFLDRERECAGKHRPFKAQSRLCRVLACAARSFHPTLRSTRLLPLLSRLSPLLLKLEVDANIRSDSASPLFLCPPPQLKPFSSPSLLLNLPCHHSRSVLTRNRSVPSLRYLAFSLIGTSRARITIILDDASCTANFLRFRSSPRSVKKLLRHT